MEKKRNEIRCKLSPKYCPLITSPFSLEQAAVTQITLQKSWKSVGYDLYIQKHCDVPLHPGHTSTIRSETTLNEQGGILAERPFPIQCSLMRFDEFFKTFHDANSILSRVAGSKYFGCLRHRPNALQITRIRHGWREVDFRWQPSPGNNLLYNIITAYMIYFIILFNYILCICIALFNEIILALVI